MEEEKENTNRLLKYLPDIVKLSNNILVKEILVSLSIGLIGKYINKGIGNKWKEENGKHPGIIKIDKCFS